MASGCRQKCTARREVNTYPGEFFVWTLRIGSVREAYEGRLLELGASASWAGEAGWRPIETLGCRRAWRVIVPSVKRVRGAQVKVWARPSIRSPGRLKPKGAPSGRRTKPLPNRQELLRGWRPRNRGPFRPARRFGGGNTDRAKR